MVGGKIQDKNGFGISGVSVKISGNANTATDISDTMGGFLFNGVTSGTYTVITEAEERVFKPSGIDISVADSGIDTLKFTIAENRIHGKIIDIITNKGIPDIPVSIQQNSPHHTREVVLTDSKGRYEFYDIPADDYSFQLDTYWDNKGMASQTFYYLNRDAFTKLELSGPDFYMFSEVLQIITATFSEETNTVHLEWTPSKSNLCAGYMIFRTGKLPLGSGTGIGEPYETNSAFIEITPKYRAPINYAISILQYMLLIIQPMVGGLPALIPNW